MHTTATISWPAGVSWRSFDASPSYDESDIRFVSRIEGASAHDDLGATAMDSVSLAVSQFKNVELTALWKSITGQEGFHE